MKVNWKTSQPILGTVPQQAPPVFVGDRLLFYALLDESTPFDHTTTVELVSKRREQPLGVVRIDHIPSVLTAPTVTRLAAKALLRELQHASSSTPNERLVDLSIKYGILCPHTAFIGLEKRLNADAESNAVMELREVPITLGPSSTNRFRRSQFDIDSVNNIMRGNIAMVLERDEILDTLACRSADLCMSARQFRSTASTCKRKSGISFGSILQPVVGYVSSFFARKTDSESEKDLALGWPTTGQQLVERIIERQQYDGLWTLTEEDALQLTGKPLTHFSSSVLDTVDTGHRQLAMATAIVIAVLEKRCAASRTLWQVISNKARQQLTVLCQDDQTKVQQLVQDMRDQLI